jgi:ribonucleoside-diphosphate reductase alpha chain
LEPFVNKHLKQALEEAGCFNDSIMQEIMTRGSLQGVDGVPDSLKRVFVTAMDISPEDHIKMQSELQKYCCNAISKTINFRENASKKLVRDAFVQGWKSGCKGLTVYRNGSRKSQVMDAHVESAGLIQTCVTTCKNGLCDV